MNSRSVAAVHVQGHRQDKEQLGAEPQPSAPFVHAHGLLVVAAGGEGTAETLLFGHHSSWRNC